MSKTKDSEHQIISSISAIKKDIATVKQVTDRIGGIKKVILALFGVSALLSLADFVYHRISLKRTIRREVNKELQPLKEEIRELKEQNRRLAGKNEKPGERQPVR